MTTARKLDALLRNYEHTHVIDELRSWLDENNTERKHLIQSKNHQLFKFQMTQTLYKGPQTCSSDQTRTINVDCLGIDRAALSKMYLSNALETTFDKRGLDTNFENLYNFVDKQGKPVRMKELPKAAKITTRISGLPDTLFIFVNRMMNQDTQTGQSIDKSVLLCPKTIDFKWEGYKSLLTPKAKTHRYTLVGAIVGEGEAASNDLDFSAFAIVRCGHGVWYRVDDADGLSEPVLHGVLMKKGEVMNILHPSGVLPGERRTTFVMRLYYRIHEEVLPKPPFKKESDMANYPSSFIGLFDQGSQCREVAIQTVMAHATEDLEYNHTIGMIELMRRMPPLDECGIGGETLTLNVGVGPGNETPEGMLKLLDMRPDVLVGRTAFEVVRVRSLMAIFSKHFTHAQIREFFSTDATSKTVLTWAVREWKTLSDDQKQGWILVADYFNIMFTNRLYFEVDGVAERSRQRISAFGLFVEQWPVLIGKKLACDTTEDADDAHPAGWFNKDPEQDVTLLVEDKQAIASIAGNPATMNDIWNDMDPSAKAVFTELARWRNDMNVGVDQGTYETWERLPFRGLYAQMGDHPATASVLRMDLVLEAKVDKDPRMIRIKEIVATATPMPNALPNAHVQLAMMEEAANPYVHYSSENFALSVNTCTMRFLKAEPSKDEEIVKKNMNLMCVDVDPFVDVDYEGDRATATPIQKMLDVQASHVNLGWEDACGIAHNHCVTNAPDTLAVRVTPWTQALFVDDPKLYAQLQVNYELKPVMDGGLVNVSYAQYIDKRTFAGYRDDGTKFPTDRTVPDRYDLVGILAIQRAKPPETELTKRLPVRGKISRADWNQLGRGKDQTDSLVTDMQREAIYKLVMTWGLVYPGGNPPPANQSVPIHNSQLDAMLRAATGVLRLSLGRVEEDPGETKERAVQECVERTMINLFALRQHCISTELWQKFFNLVNGEAPPPPDAINNQLCAVMKQLKEPEDRQWKIAKDLNLPPVTKSECVYLITKYLGQGTAFLGARAAKDALPVDAVCKTESEDATPFACMIPPAKRTQFWQRGGYSELDDSWAYFEGGNPSHPIKVNYKDLPRTLKAGLDKDTQDEYSLVFYYRRVENWKRETDFIEQLITYTRGYTPDMIKKRFPQHLPARSLALMAHSPFLRRELYNVAVESIRTEAAKRSLLQFMGWLTFGVGQEQETAIRMISDPSVRQDGFDSFLCSKAYSKKGVAAFYVKANKSKKVASAVSGGFDGEEDAAPAPTPEELARAAEEEAERVARTRAAEEEARARREALEAEQRERERVAAKEAAAREAAIRDRLAADAAERAARAAEEAAEARKARIERQARDAAQQEARDAARRTKEDDEKARKKALAKQKSEEKKAAKAANNARKKGPSAIKLEEERKARHSAEVAQQEAEAKAVAKAAEAKAAAKRAARAAAAAPLQAEAEAKTAAAEARAAARAAERAAERAAILEADELAEQAEFESAEEWAAEQAAPPSSPLSTSTAASTAASTAWTHGGWDVDAQCVICFEGVRDHLCLPCKHLCVCARCVSGTSLETCPMCRQPVEEILNVFW